MHAGVNIDMEVNNNQGHGHLEGCLTQNKFRREQPIPRLHNKQYNQLSSVVCVIMFTQST